MSNKYWNGMNLQEYLAYEAPFKKQAEVSQIVIKLNLTVKILSKTE